MAEMITVACKLPCGLRVDHEGRTVYFKGANSTMRLQGPLEANYGVTEGVDKAWFDSWFAFAAEHDFAPVTQGSVFSAADPDRAKHMAAERAGDTDTGMQGVDPEDPGDGIEMTDETKKLLAARK